jgi:hypothetical protein
MHVSVGMFYDLLDLEGGRGWEGGCAFFLLLAVVGPFEVRMGVGWAFWAARQWRWSLLSGVFMTLEVLIVQAFCCQVASSTRNMLLLRFPLLSRQRLRSFAVDSLVVDYSSVVMAYPVV